MRALSRALAIVIAAGALAACAARPPQLTGAAAQCPAAQPAFDPASVRQAILDGAAAEWHRWGERVVALEPERSLVALRGGPWEDEREVYADLARYWCAAGRNYFRLAADDVGTGDLIDEHGQVRRQVYEQVRVGHAPFADAWSAAFVSAVLYGAGVPREQFRFSIAHWTYVSAIIRRAREAEAAGTSDELGFVPHALADYRVQPGDLVCATREGPRLPDFAALLEHSHPMHCEIVVAAEEPCTNAESRRCLASIGGNVVQSVVRTLVPLDRTGHVMLLPQSRDWIVVIENRLDRLPRPTS
jgi:hypothetical protein